MINLAAMGANSLAQLLVDEFRCFFGPSHGERAERLGITARIALECLARSDALYHTVEHTLLVTLVGLDILRGRSLSERLEPDDFAHLLTACLLHDIGYVRGVLRKDLEGKFIINERGDTISLRRGASDASLGPHHVDRSKLFARERLGSSPNLKADRVIRAIEWTRFPSEDREPDSPANEEGRLVQAADLIGQLGDPLYLKKANALFYEFEENGLNRQLGYASPADLVDKYPAFYWDAVAPHIDHAITYLNVTASGRQWIANLHSHIFAAQHAFGLMGPQR